MASVGYGSIRYMLIHREGGQSRRRGYAAIDFDPTSFDPQRLWQ